MPRTATITLRTGVTRAQLPGSRVAVAGQNYTIPWEDFEQISPEALQTVVRVVSLGDAPAAKRASVNLATNSTTVPAGFFLGDVEEGYGNDRFRLVKLVDAVAATDGAALVWADKAENEVTMDKVGGSALSPLQFAGFAVGAITADRYAWIQIDGIADAPVMSAATAGQALTLHPTTDGAVRTMTNSETVLITTGTASAGTFTLTYAGQTTAGIAFNANAAAVETALENLSNIAPADVSVSGTGVLTAAGGVTVTFADTLAEQNLSDLTGTGTGLTGGPLTLTVTQGYADQDTTIIGTSLGADGVAIRGTGVRRHRLLRRRWNS